MTASPLDLRAEVQNEPPTVTVTGTTAPPGGSTFLFTHSTTTTDSDPGAGTLRLDSGTYGSVTTIFVDLADFYGSDITDWLDSLDDSTNTVKGLVRVSSVSDPTKWWAGQLTAVTTATGYRKLVATYVDHNGTLTTTPGDTMLTFTPAGNAGSTGSTGATGAGVVEVVVLPAEMTVIVEDGIGGIRYWVPAWANGLNLVSAHACVTTVSSSGTPTFQIANVTDSVDMLSTKITIDANEKTSYSATAAPVIDTSHDDVATGDELRFDCDVAGTGTKGVTFILGFA